MHYVRKIVMDVIFPLTFVNNKWFIDFIAWRYFTPRCNMICKKCDPRDGYNLNKLGRGPLGDATYQISKP